MQGPLHHHVPSIYMQLCIKIKQSKYQYCPGSQSSRPLPQTGCVCFPFEYAYAFELEPLSLCVGVCNTQREREGPPLPHSPNKLIFTQQINRRNSNNPVKRSQQIKMATQNNTSEKQGCRDVGGGEESSRYPHFI